MIVVVVGLVCWCVIYDCVDDVVEWCELVVVCVDEE